MSVFFNGNLYITPAVASQIDDSAMANQNVGMPMNLALIGHADGGVPGQVYKFQSPSDAAAILKSGELLTAIQKAFAPSSQTNAPQYIFAQRVDWATPSVFVVPQSGAATATGAFQAVAQGTDTNGRPLPGTVTLAASSSGGDNFYENFQILITSGKGAGQTNLITGYTGATKVANVKYIWTVPPQAGDAYQIIPAVMILTTQDYGVYTPQTAVQIQPGSVSGYKVAVEYGQALYSQDNLGAMLFTLAYTGAAASCLLSINGTTLTVATGALGSEAVEYSVNLANYPTVNALAAFLNTKPDLQAVVTSQYLNTATTGTFDLFANAQVKGAGALPVTANLWAVMNWINSQSCPLLTATAPAAFAGTTAPATCNYTYMTGGQNLGSVSADWTNCLASLQGEDVQCVVTLCSDPSVHASLLGHCEYMSNQGRSERRGIVGGALGETITQAVARAFNLNSDRIYLASCGYQDYDANGNLATFAPYMSAAILGGMICGLNPGNALTNKSISVAGLERYDRVPADTDTLIQGGVLPLVKTKYGYQVCKSISTWLQNSNYNRVEMSTGYACDYISRAVRDAVQPLIGTEGSPYSLATIASRVDTCLRQLAMPAPQGLGVIVGDANSPAYQNIVVTLSGDTVNISFQASPVIPVNYEFITVSVVPYSGSVTMAVPSAS